MAIAEADPRRTVEDLPSSPHSGPSRREHSPRAEGLYVRPNPFEGMVIDAEGKEYDETQRRILIPVYTANGHRGVMAIIDGNVSVLVPSGLKQIQQDDLPESYVPVRFARLYIQPTGETALDYNVTLDQETAATYGLEVTELSELDQRTINYNMTRLNRGIDPNRFAHSEVMSVLYALTDSTEQTHEAMYYEDHQAREDALHVHEAIKTAAYIVGQNRSEVANRILPRNVDQPNPIDLTYNSEGVSVTFSLSNNQTPQESTLVSAQIARSFLADDIAHVTFNTLTHQGNQVTFQVSPQDREIYSSLGANKPGQLERVTKHQDWVVDLTRRLLEATQSVLQHRDSDIEASKSIAENAEDNRSVVIAGLARVARKYNGHVPANRPDASPYLLPRGWKKGSVNITSYPALSAKPIAFQVSGENIRDRAQVRVGLLQGDKHGFADIQITHGPSINDTFRVQRDGTIMTWRKKGKKYKLKPSTEAERIVVRKLISYGLIPALRRKDGVLDDAQRILTAAAPIVARPDFRSVIVEDSRRFLTSTRRGIQEVRALAAVPEELTKADLEWKDNLEEIRELQREGSEHAERLRRMAIMGAHQLYQQEMQEPSTHAA